MNYWCPEQGWTGVPDAADYERELQRYATTAAGGASCASVTVAPTTPSHSALLRPFHEPPTHQVGAVYTCGCCGSRLIHGHMCVRIETPTGSYTKIISQEGR